MKLLCVRGHHIWPAPLTSSSIVIDAGAHRGEFSAELNRRFGCKCHLVEPNPSLATELRTSAFASVTQAALSGHDGRALLHLAENLESSSLPSTGTNSPGSTAIEVETITLATLMKRLALPRIDLLKLDIEGAEFDVIAMAPDEVLRRISQLTVEFHDFQARFKGRQLFESARARLESLGFVCGLLSFRTHGDVLFLNRRLSKISRFSIFYLRVIARIAEKLRSRLT